MKWWWLSFCDPSRPEGQQFLGACIVRAQNLGHAALRAHMLACNPGGEVSGQNFELDMTETEVAQWTDKLFVSSQFANTLLAKIEARYNELEARKN